MYKIYPSIYKIFTYIFKMSINPIIEIFVKTELYKYIICSEELYNNCCFFTSKSDVFI